MSIEHACSMLNYHIDKIKKPSESSQGNSQEAREENQFNKKIT
jgi:hypothetical protein